MCKWFSKKPVQRENVLGRFISSSRRTQKPASSYQENGEIRAKLPKVEVFADYAHNLQSWPKNGVKTTKKQQH